MEHVNIASEQDYQARKAFFQKNENIYSYSSFGNAKESLDELTHDFEESNPAVGTLSFPEVNVFLDDIAFQSSEAQSYLKEYRESLKEMRPFEQDQYTPGVEATQW